ncbi:hypothetical protein A3L12_00400 [Thermococcus sp. P6]|uniref:DUF2240 family protein n=1 Tax=Thermococcus sp. P6 TaxID=122420 RepID=UPI000B59DAC9|nr:DUF2240 family protein [Thermococcus sp. P6]ASJ09869.1 hypothetical protein A3L12_00400 [Thermococcus sp. P6]
MHPLKRAVEYKGSAEFTRSELVGILAFSLRLMDVKSAKELIEQSIKKGLLTEREGKLLVNGSMLKDEGGDPFEEMVEYISASLGWERDEVMKGIRGMRERYGDLDEKLLAYLFGMSMGLDMSRFRDVLEL